MDGGEWGGGGDRLDIPEKTPGGPITYCGTKLK